MTTLKNKVIDVFLKFFALDGPARRKFSDPDLIIKGAGVQAGQTVLEVGCGRGFFTIPLAEAVGPEGYLYALDVTQVAVDHVTQKVQAAGLSNIRVFRANAVESGLPENTVNSALLFGVIPSPTIPLKQLLPEMYRVLKPGGALAVWTVMPGWSPNVVVQSGLFTYLGRTNNVHSFQRI